MTGNDPRISKTTNESANASDAEGKQHQLARAASTNYDDATVQGFGEEWHRFNQSDINDDEIKTLSDEYFRIFPWDALPSDATGFDMGCGTGRWAKLVAPKVGQLYCIDASSKALDVARKNLAAFNNCYFLEAMVDTLPLADSSMDFGYSLGVLHHVPDTSAGIKACVRKLKPGSPFLLYIYYAFDNKPAWFRLIWRASDVVRRAISKLPFTAKCLVTDAIAVSVYVPLAKTANQANKFNRGRLHTF